jgi:hypothetical protein
MRLLSAGISGSSGVYGCATPAEWDGGTVEPVSERLRLASFAAVVFVSLFGAGEFAGWIGESLRGPSWWATDLDLVLRTGERLAFAQPLYSDPKFLYPPLAAVLAAPLAVLDPFALSLAYVALKLGLTIVAVGVLTSGWALRDRGLVLAGLILSLPFLHDVFLGNANVWLAVAIAMAAHGRPTARGGVALGLVTAVFAKPLVIPVLVWLLVFRRQVLVGVVATGLAATLIGLLATGPSSYLA